MGWVIVAGGAKNLGRALCVELARRKFSICVHFHTSQMSAEETAQLCRKEGVEAECLGGDFSTPVSVELFVSECLKRYADLSGIVYNVGNYLVKPIAETPVSDWNTLFQTNIFAPIAISQALMPRLLQNDGRIIVLGAAGLNGQRANRFAPAYEASKICLLHWVKSLALDSAPQGVCINMVSPGHLMHSIDLNEDLDRIPMKRPAMNEEICNVVTFLMAPENRYITGQNIEVAGGFLL